MTNLNTKNLILSFVVILQFALTSYVHAEVVIIVHADNNTTSLSKSELNRLFMGKMDNFPSGGKATPVNQVATASARVEFDSSKLGKSTSKMTAYWSKQLFMGKSVPPKELSSDADVVSFVSGNPSAIGYIDSSSVNQSVKVVTIQ